MTIPDLRNVRIDSERIYLREFLEADVDAMLDMHADAALARYQPTGVFDRAKVEGLLSQILDDASASPRTEYKLAAIWRETDQLVGMGRLGIDRDGRHRSAEIGGVAHPAWWGTGGSLIGSRLMLHLAFDSLKLHRVWAHLHRDNEAATMLAARVGFQREGVLRDHVLVGGEWWDAAVYSILETEWRPGKRPYLVAATADADRLPA